MKLMYDKTIPQLRKEGYAIAVFTPEELGNAKPFSVENEMVINGWQAIAELKTTEPAKEP